MAFTCSLSLTFNDVPLDRAGSFISDLLAGVSIAGLRSPSTTKVKATGLNAQAAFILSALTSRPLNARQRRILQHWRDVSPAFANIEDLIEIFVAEGYAKDRDEADDFIRGALRSFGRRLKPAGFEEGVDPPPIRQLVHIEESDGVRRHSLTTAGKDAVTALFEDTDLLVGPMDD